MAKEDEATQHGCVWMRWMVRASVRMHPNIGKMKVCDCRWTDGDVVKGQISLGVDEIVGKEAALANELGK